MSEPRNTDHESWSDELSRIAHSAGQVLRLRRELAELEIRHDVQAARRLGRVGGVGAVLALWGMPLLLACLANFLARNTTLGFFSWTLILGLVLVVPGLAALWAAVRRFRRDFCGLQNSLAELNEDLVWLQEWTPQWAPSRSSGTD